MSVDGVKAPTSRPFSFPINPSLWYNCVGELGCFLGDVPNITTPNGVWSFFFILASGSLALDVGNRNG